MACSRNVDEVELVNSIVQVRMISFAFSLSFGLLAPRTGRELQSPYVTADFSILSVVRSSSRSLKFCCFQDAYLGLSCILGELTLGVVSLFTHGDSPCSEVYFT